ncbi:MAG: cupin domain-containing protein [Planctomycetes bacterium]|nr:cupin domain-containing protein [Planctomycetota bacterium]
MEFVNANELRYRHGDSGPKYLFRGPRIDWGLIRFLPGEKLGAHYHNEVEETFYFTGGTGVFLADGEEHRIEPGCAFRMEPGETHDIINTGRAPLEGMFIKHVYKPDDKVDAEVS